MKRLAVQAYVDGVRAADRAILAQAITLIESRHADDAPLAEALLNTLLPETGGATRVGITGVPGVGKSTFIDALGMRLVERGHKLAVLAIDPSSALTGGSILGDKTRMARLSLSDRAFIRPSPSGLTLGGVARRTRETMLLCEAAGFDVVFVETVGVGQGETTVADMVDFFLVLALAGAGDELQSIKKGVLELADAICVNKADGDNAARAQTQLGDLRAALKYLPRKRPSWTPPTLAVSGLTGAGLDAVWEVVTHHRAQLTAKGELATLRADQQRAWLWALIDDRLLARFKAHPDVAPHVAAIEAAVRAGTLTPTAGADDLLRRFATDAMLDA